MLPWFYEIVLEFTTSLKFCKVLLCVLWPVSTFFDLSSQKNWKPFQWERKASKCNEKSCVPAIQIGWNLVYLETMNGNSNGKCNFSSPNCQTKRNTFHWHFAKSNKMEIHCFVCLQLEIFLLSWQFGHSFFCTEKSGWTVNTERGQGKKSSQRLYLLFCFQQTKSRKNDYHPCLKLLDFWCVLRIITVTWAHDFKPHLCVTAICNAHGIVDDFFWNAHVAIRNLSRLAIAEFFPRYIRIYHTNATILFGCCLFSVRATRLNNKKNSMQRTIAVKCLRRITKNRLVNKMLDECYSFVHLICVNIQIVLHSMSSFFFCVCTQRKICASKNNEHFTKETLLRFSIYLLHILI